MNRIFKLEGPVFTFLSKFCDVLILSSLWLVFSLPVITIGASSAALYYSVHKTFLQNDGYVISTFWKSFRTNLKQGIIIEFLCIPVGLFCIASHLFSRSMDYAGVLGILYLAITILTALLLLCMVTYSFPVLSRFYMSSLEIIKTSIALSVTRLGFTLILIIIYLLCIGAVIIAPFTVFILPACYTMAAERLLEPAFKKAFEAHEAAAEGNQ